MNHTFLWTLYPIIFLFTLVGVGWLRLWIISRNILDVPNERSSHSRPTPVGGGLVITLVCIGYYLIAGFFLPGQFQWTYPVGAALIALISWLDDLFGIAFGWRLLVHTAAALLVIWGVGFLTEIQPVEGFSAVINLAGILVIFGWIVWLTNAFNFMDGIDGLAGVQTVSAGFGWLVAGNLQGFDNTGFYGGVLAFSGLGFLRHNWPPARIFMGDVGSAFLGFTFAVMPLLAFRENPAVGGLLPLLAVGLVWFFVFDSIQTFLRRLIRREKVWKAHRDHLYQKLVISGQTHRSVTILYGGLSVGLVLLMIGGLRFSLQNFVWIITAAILCLSAGLVLYIRSKKYVTNG